MSIIIERSLTLRRSASLRRREERKRKREEEAAKEAAEKEARKKAKLEEEAKAQAEEAAKLKAEAAAEVSAKDAATEPVSASLIWLGRSRESRLFTSQQTVWLSGIPLFMMAEGYVSVWKIFRDLVVCLFYIALLRCTHVMYQSRNIAEASCEPWKAQTVEFAVDRWGQDSKKGKLT